MIYQKYFSLKHPKIRFRNRRLLHQISQQTRNMHIFFFGIIFENGFKHIFGICKFFLALVPAMSHSDFDQFRFQFLINPKLFKKTVQTLFFTALIYSVSDLFFSIQNAHSTYHPRCCHKTWNEPQLLLQVSYVMYF